MGDVEGFDWMRGGFVFLSLLEGLLGCSELYIVYFVLPNLVLK